MRRLMWLALAACGGLEDPPGGRACVALEPVEACPVVELEAPACDGAPVDVGTLLAEMSDLGRLARPGCARFTTHQASSRDPRSAVPEPPSHSIEGWFANVDWGHYLRAEATASGRVEHVLLDVEGPGAIVKMWTANGDGATLRVYLDGAATPAIEESFAALLSGRIPPFTAPFAAVSSTGRNLDFPIPFRGRVKVTVDGDAHTVYWQLIYRRYDPGADVRTFAWDHIPDLRPVADRLRGAAQAGDVESCLRARDQQLVLPAHPGGSEIVELAVLPGDRGARALRETVLSLTFDGRETARVPLGDFFGSGPGFHPHRTLPLDVTSDGWLVSRFVMPFRCAAVVRVLGSPSQTVWLSVRHRPAAFTADTLHFFAQWIARGPLPTRPFRDLTIAEVRGRGTWVGGMLAMDSRVRDWWGEGDEKVWVDDDAFPRWFGTGTEDYFGYANATRQAYEHPYRVLARTGGARGQVTSARFHLLDAIPFASSLRFDLELFHWNQDATVFFDTMAWLYAAPEAVNLLPPPSPSEFRLPRSR